MQILAINRIDDTTMKRQTIHSDTRRRFRSAVVLAFTAASMFSACTPRTQTSESGAGQDPAAPVGTPGRSGAVLTLSAEQAGQFATQPATDHVFVTDLKAYGRSVVSAIASSDAHTPLLLFESSDVAQLFSDFTKARAALDRSSKQLERLRELYSRDATSGKDLLDAETDSRQNEASLREAESKLRQSGLDPVVLASLRTGVVLIIAEVPEAKIRFVDPEERAEIEFNSYPGVIFTGNVRSIGDVVDPQTRTIRVGIVLKNPKNTLKTGMFCRVAIEESTERSVAVASSAVVSADARSFVFVKTGPGTFERREVITGSDDGVRFQILSGLKTGESVVTSNAILLKGLSFGY